MDKYEFINKYMTTPYVALGRNPEQGLDCWGLIYFYYKEVLDIELPICDNVSYESTDNFRKLEIKKRSENFQEISDAEENAIVCVSIASHPFHIGLMLDNKNMLHTTSKTGIVVEDIKTRKFENRIYGFFK